MSGNMDLLHQTYFATLPAFKNELLQMPQVAPYVGPTIHQVFSQFENTTNPCYMDAMDAPIMISITKNGGQFPQLYANIIKDIMVVYVAAEYIKMQYNLQQHYPESVINGQGVLAELFEYRKRITHPPQNPYGGYPTQPQYQQPPQQHYQPTYQPQNNMGVNPAAFQGGQVYQNAYQPPHHQQSKNVLTTAIGETNMNRDEHIKPPQVDAMAFNAGRYTGVPVTQHDNYDIPTSSPVQPSQPVVDPEPDVEIKVLDDKIYFDPETDDGFITSQVNNLTVPVELLDYLATKKIVKTATLFNGTEVHYVKCPKVEPQSDIEISLTYYMDKVFSISNDFNEIVEGIITLKHDLGFTQLATWLDVKLVRFIRLVLKLRFGLNDADVPDFSLLENWVAVSEELKRNNMLDAVATASVAVVNKLFNMIEWVDVEDKPNTVLLRFTVLIDVLVVGDELIYDHQEKRLQRKVDKTSKNLDRVFKKIFNDDLKETDYFFDIYDVTSVVYRVYRNSVQFSDSYYTVDVISP